MAEKNATWVETLLQRIGTDSPGQRLALNSAELVRTNGDHTLFFAHKIDELLLRPHLPLLREIVGTPVKLEYRASATAPATQSPIIPAPATDPRTELGMLPQAPGDMVDYAALQATFAKIPFQVFHNNRAASDILLRDVLNTFPGHLSEKKRPYALVGGVGVGKTSTIEHAVHDVESRRRRAIAAYQERDYGKALALARETVGSAANTEQELWQRVRALASSRICHEGAQRIKDDYKEIGELAHHGNKDLADARAKKFHERHKNLDLWVVDDIQMLSQGKPTATLEWLFSKIQDLYEHRKPVIVTSDKSPAHFENFPEHTRTRLAENICHLSLPTDDDKKAYVAFKFDEMARAGMDLTKYKNDWLPMIVRVADHYRHINALFNNITNNGNTQQSLFNPAQLFEQALEVIGKDSETAKGTYNVRRIINTVISLAGITEKELKESEAEMRRYKNYDNLLTKRTALVLASKMTTLDYGDLATFIGYNGVTPKQRAGTVEGVLKDCGDVYVDPSQPVEQQFLRVYKVIQENLDRKGNPLFPKK